MEFIEIGKLVNTHALKGEVRILSFFEYKNKVFIINNNLYIFGEKLTIETYRTHKNYDLVKFKEYNNINDVQKFKGQKVFCLKEDLNLENDEILDRDLIGYKAIYNGKDIGKIESIENYGNKVLRINNNLIPYNKNFIDKIDKECDTIYLKNLEGLFNEKN